MRIHTRFLTVGIRGSVCDHSVVNFSFDGIRITRLYFLIDLLHLRWTVGFNSYRFPYPVRSWNHDTKFLWTFASFKYQGGSHILFFALLTSISQSRYRVIAFIDSLTWLTEIGSYFSVSFQVFYLEIFGYNFIFIYSGKTFCRYVFLRRRLTNLLDLWSFSLLIPPKPSRSKSTFMFVSIYVRISQAPTTTWEF